MQGSLEPGSLGPLQMVPPPREVITGMSQDSTCQEEGVLLISQMLNFASKRATGCTSIDAPCPGVLGVLVTELSLL